ncbi:GntP family permease [Vaginisenegalia massiliensis]|uniref:GntP family permease n=1 Tax=Vaginisenegalia massiliensis TaxID=2058294 RepID=UPI000F53E6A9|nr:GntP family permease [Vaginisenegalia massiliensis]
MTYTTLGAMVGLIVAIILIVKNFPPAYSLILGSLIGGLVGGGSLMQTITTIVEGASGMMSSVLRILTAGILAGVLIKSGAAESISKTIIQRLGRKRALIALAIATLCLTAVGVFIDIAVITVAPIGLVLADELEIPRPILLLAMIGGGKAGNIMSPNPNTIALSEAYKVNLFSLMSANIIPAIVALVVTILLVKMLQAKGTFVYEKQAGLVANDDSITELPSFAKAISGPVIVIVLLMLRPLMGITIDPLIALPLGAILGLIIMGHAKKLNDFASFGLNKMIPVAVLLIGTGTIAGIIKNSYLQQDIINLINLMGIPSTLLAPLSGILMSGATASTTAGSTVASQSFGSAILKMGMTPMAAAMTTHTGATVLDHLPHGSFFHATAGSVQLDITNRMKLIPFESLIGLAATLASIFVAQLFFG